MPFLRAAIPRLLAAAPARRGGGLHRWFHASSIVRLGRTTGHTGGVPPSDIIQATTRTGNASQYRGVSWISQSGTWRACISIGQSKVLLGTFPTEEEAARAYDRAAREYHRYPVTNWDDQGLLNPHRKESARVLNLKYVAMGDVTHHSLSLCETVADCAATCAVEYPGPRKGLPGAPRLTKGSGRYYCNLVLKLQLGKH